MINKLRKIEEWNKLDLGPPGYLDIVEVDEKILHLTYLPRQVDLGRYCVVDIETTGIKPLVGGNRLTCIGWIAGRRIDQIFFSSELTAEETIHLGRKLAAKYLTGYIRGAFNKNFEENWLKISFPNEIQKIRMEKKNKTIDINGLSKEDGMEAVNAYKNKDWNLLRFHNLSCLLYESTLYQINPYVKKDPFNRYVSTYKR